MAKIIANALICAIQTGDIAYIERLCSGDDTGWMTDTDSRGKCAIHYACDSGQNAIVTLLLQKKPDLLNLPDGRNNTPVLLAVSGNHYEVVVNLAKRGADLNKATQRKDHECNGYAPIHYAVLYNYGKIVQYLIETFPQIRLQVTGRKLDLIHIACKKGWRELVEFLLQRRPWSINMIDDFGQTPVLLASKHGHIALVDHLITKYSVDITKSSQYQDTNNHRHGYLPIHWATELDYANIVESLIRYLIRKNPNFDIHMQLDHMRLGRMRYHLLHIASMAGALETIKVLLDIDPTSLNVEDAQGKTPVFLAAVHGHTRVVQYFISKKADLKNNVTHNIMLEKIRNTNGPSVANAILVMLTSDNPEEILPHMASVAQVLDMLALDNPALVADMIRCIDSIIAKSTVTMAVDTELSFYRVSQTPPHGGIGRRSPSVLVKLNRQTGACQVYKPAQKIGNGVSGCARLFHDSSGHDIVVKAPIEDSNCDDYRKEERLYKQAYPKGGFSSVFTFFNPHNIEEKKTQRYVMPYVKGETARDFISHISSAFQLAVVILKIAQELQRVHGCGVIHGDINSGNIMVFADKNKDKEVIVEFIDFGLGSFMTDGSAVLFDEHVLGTASIAPELCNNKVKPVKPNTNQDVYGLGVVCGYFLRKKQALSVQTIFSSIDTFISESRNTDPDQRPLLATFCEALSGELEAIEPSSRYLR